jgi:hypothetical protein
VVRGWVLVCAIDEKLALFVFLAVIAGKEMPAPIHASIAFPHFLVEFDIGGQIANL